MYVNIYPQGGSTDADSPSKCNGEYHLMRVSYRGHTASYLHRDGGRFGYKVSAHSESLWYAHCFLPDRRHIAALLTHRLPTDDESPAEEPLWLALFRLGHTWSVTKRQLDLRYSDAFNVCWTRMHTCAER